jgi:hypothetical protein
VVRKLVNRPWAWFVKQSSARPMAVSSLPADWLMREELTKLLIG